MGGCYLNPAIPEDYPERVYAGWLGKIIGVRLGAPIEGMLYQKIKDLFGEINGYLIDYNDFAADDDSNGPIFFVRALEDSGKGVHMTSQDVADSLLNYAPYEHGFFWWGGYGVSTEHTAYLNLQKGIPAPLSGSAQINGIATAEQIGGQIFSDCWGLVAPNSPNLAAHLAEQASRVSHDGNAVYGGRFVAACISLAFSERNICDIIEKALALLPGDCEYVRVARNVINFHQTHPENWRDCFHYVEENFGYDKYPGACHVIPNAAVMILSLLYGEGRFDDTIQICCMCGWDTDCNGGNVGTIVGVLNGIDGIDEQKWRKPIHDFLACSGVLGYLNHTDLPAGAAYMAALGYKLNETEIPAKWKLPLENYRDCWFSFPGSTHDIRVLVHPDPKFRYRGEYNLSNEIADTCVGGRALKIYCCRVTKNQVVDIARRTYLHNTDFNDSRYDPSFSPILYPGETISARLCTPEYGFGFAACMYAKLRSGVYLQGKTQSMVPGQWETLSMQIPFCTDLIEQAGVRCIVDGPETEKAELCVLLDWLTFAGNPNYRVAFINEQLEYWRPTHKEVTQFSRLRGTDALEDGKLVLSDPERGEVYTGSLQWKDYRVCAKVCPECGNAHLLLLRVQGAIRSYAFGLYESGKVALLKNENGYHIVSETAFDWHHGASYTLEVKANGNELICSVDGCQLLRYRDSGKAYLSGAVGLAVFNGSKTSAEYLEVRSD